MDEDIKFPISFISDGSSGAITTYAHVPYRSTFRQAWGVIQGDPGDSMVITVSVGSSTLGTLTWGASVAAGDQGTWAANASTGDTIMAAAAALKFVTSNTGNAVQVDLLYELDPKARAA
jgi:hypothetical protein